MFTRKQIEEIAVKLADLSIKDSQFDDVNTLFNGSESVPILQDNQNRLLSFAELVSIVRQSEDTGLIKCVLTVNCSTAGAVVKINGSRTTTATVSWGSMVDVEISADGYITWYGVLTMTQNHTLNIALSEKYEEETTPVATTCVVQITNNQGAQITINGSQVASGSRNVFDKGSKVRIIVSGYGYETEDTGVFTLNDDFIETIDLNEASVKDTDPFLRFSTNDEVFLPASGDAVTSVSVESNVNWAITTKEVERPQEEGSGGDDEEPVEIEPAQQEFTVLSDVTIQVGQTYKFE